MKIGDPSNSLKTCSKCEESRSIDEFYNGDYECKECRKSRSLRDYKKGNANERRKQDRKSNPMKYREWEVKRSYGITAEQYHSLLETQEYRCAGCRVEFSDVNLPYVDHDHACCPQKRGCCGKCVRGALCILCNLALGSVKDSEETLSRLIKYLNGENK